jgi:hypothetical protein
MRHSSWENASRKSIEDQRWGRRPRARSCASTNRSTRRFMMAVGLWLILVARSLQLAQLAISPSESAPSDKFACRMPRKITIGDQLRQPMLERPRDFVAALAQLRRNERKAESGVSPIPACRSTTYTGRPPATTRERLGTPLACATAPAKAPIAFAFRRQSCCPTRAARRASRC